ncbi:hypothetical protein F0562_002737 [Nyssa sinensis]|uniref:Uncharacterized protein n=1 Tax=Nyssa sinensis TaxID=561372 RepID=A0A5J5BV67_9ASTE|nr:hypothetical protein F0562_002737 [Nyssa sinensis]
MWFIQILCSLNTRSERLHTGINIIRYIGVKRLVRAFLLLINSYWFDTVDFPSFHFQQQKNLHCLTVVQGSGLLSWIGSYLG